MSTVTTFTGQSDIASYNFGPVLTQFVAPESCVSIFTSLSSQLYFDHWYNVWNSACYPSMHTTMDTTTALDLFYWSPAQCPTGWSAVSVFTSVFTADRAKVLTALSLGADTTAVACCPSGFNYNGFGRVCASTASFNSLTPSLNTLLYFNGDILSSQDFAPTSEPSTLTLTSDMTISGDGIPVWWQSSDLSNFVLATSITSHSITSSSQSSTPSTLNPTTSSLAKSSTPTSTSSPTQSTPASTQSASAIGTSNPASSGLSNGAKIGIAAGIPTAFLILGTILFVMYKRRTSHWSDEKIGEVERFELHRPELSTDGALSESHSNHNPVELSAVWALSELHADSSRLL